MRSINFKRSLDQRKEILIHVGFWLLLFYFALIRLDKNSPSYFSILTPDILTISWAVVFIMGFYFNYLLIMPRVFRNFKSWKVFAGILIYYLFFTGLRFLIEEVLLEILFGMSNYSEGTPGLYYLYDNLYYSSFPLIPSTLLWLVIFLIRLLEYNNFVVEENHHTQVKFLQAQLNPHFMFNTLNNIYSLVYFGSDKALPAIEKLSGIMRFTTYESQKEKILLEEEISYIESYIELERLRQQDNPLVKMELKAENLYLKIPPLLLSPLVENALKHGVMKESPVEIFLEQGEKRLCFRVSNVIGKQKKDKIGGIGLENLRKRLKLYYPKQHRLSLKEENNKFIAELEIQF